MGFTVLGVIIAAYVLAHFGYISHSAPSKAASGFGSRGYGSGYSTPQIAPVEMKRQRYEI